MHRARERVMNIAFEDNDDEDNEDEFIIFAIRRPRWIRERAEDFDTMDDTDFVTRYRLSKPTVLSMLEKIEDALEFETDRNNCISPINQLLCTLRYYATGCFQTTGGDLCGFSSSTMNRIVHKVSCAIALLRSQYIHFPDNPEEIRRTQLEFYRRAKFPRVVGAIDCTHIKLWQSPGGDTAERFRNRKGYYSLNVQAICNANLEVMDVVARYDGSTHDSRIFRESKRRALFEQGVYGDALLVGDSGYACTSYMMTPLHECHTPAEQLYNESQIRTRNPIERFFGVWKRRFPVMALGLRVKLKRVFPIITATLVLNNIARRAGEEVPRGLEIILPAPWEEILAQDDIPNEYMDIPNPTQRRLTHQNRERQVLIDSHFERLAAQDQQ
ncbi:unnamed protein product [Macrosiphum euphorbiae]|uniref:Putative nuclease HARBI1 n=1 Tax=Macrosiphum euphorbiae TaxID=13131 RepID=A0AAV0WNX9_9HEMI|nr:unnamed protein product [Macrosiphum euphorbiae]